MQERRERATRASAVIEERIQRPAEREVVPEAVPPSRWRMIFNYENLFWLGIFVVAIVSRFWDIGNRGIHHDESLHAHFSRLLYAGQGYTHDPMMHGPLQFHFVSLMYWLFGTTDATARFASAFSGIFVVMSPFFLRQQLGRLTALICGFLLLISPTILYFSRMAREDSIFSAMEMIMIIGLWRFVSTRKPGDFFVFCAGLSLMFTIKETAYLTVAILGVFFLLLFAYQSGYAILGTLGAYVATLGALFLFVNNGMKAATIPPLPDIPVTNPNYEILMGFVTALITHPLIYGAAGLTLAFIIGLIALFRMQASRVRAEALQRRQVVLRRAVGSVPSRRPRPEATEEIEISSDGHGDVPGKDGEASTIVASEAADLAERDPNEVTEVWDPKRLDPKPGTLLARYQPGSLPHLLGALFARPKVLLIGFAIAAVIYVLFYTVFFTDIPRGIASGLFGSVGYWMAQHDVRRGDQPWFYYLLLIPLYEPIAAFFSLAAASFFSWRGIRWLLRRREDARYDPAAPRLGAFNLDRPVPFASFNAFMVAFLAWWLFGATAVYSWAGEKMPWLVVHMVRPAIFFAALFIGALVMSLIKRRQQRLAAEGALVPAAAETYIEERPLPVRRRPAVRAPAPVVIRRQEPPWVEWSKPGSRFPAVSFLAIFGVLALAWGLTMNAFVFAGNYSAWWMTWLFPLAMIALAVSYGLWLGAGRALRYFALGILGLGLVYQVHSAVYLTYNHPDVPTEMAVYVQTSPDVTRIMREIERYSYATTGGKDVKIMYDGFTSWPFVWYLRDYRNAQLIGQGAEANPDVATTPILLLEYGVHKDKPKLLENYIPQRYAMRWWFPQDWYMRDFIPGQNYRTSPFNEQVGGALNTIWVTFTDPVNQGKLWKYLVFRETPMELGSEDLILYLRKDIAQQFHYLQNPPPPSTDVPVTPVNPTQVPKPSLWEPPNSGE